MKSRIVIDTSTLISAALRSNSIPRQALRHVLESYELCLSQSLTAELELSMSRPRLLKYASAGAFRAFVESLKSDARSYSLTSEQISGVLPCCRDPRDNHVLALAQIASADCIISSDQDLLVLHPWRGIPVLGPAQFLDHF